MVSSSLYFFLCPKPGSLVGEPSDDFIDQVSWITSSIQGAQIVVFSETDLISDWCKHNCIRYLDRSYFTSEGSTIPCTKSIFQCIHNIAGVNDICIYLNCDITLGDDFVRLINFSRAFYGYFAITGRRLNVNRDKDGTLVLSNFQHWGTDYYIYRLPEPLCTKAYLIGRFFWDGHIISKLVRLYKDGLIRVFDASNVALPLHINHSYDWGAKSNSTDRLSLIHEDVFTNLKLTSLFEWYSIQALPLKLANAGSTLVVCRDSSFKRLFLDSKYRIVFVVNYVRLYLFNLLAHKLRQSKIFTRVSQGFL